MEMKMSRNKKMLITKYSVIMFMKNCKKILDNKEYLEADTDVCTTPLSKKLKQML